MRAILRQLIATAWARLPAEQPGSPPPVAVDFETFYRSEKRAQKQHRSPCTADLQGNWAYCRHPEWEAYLVSLYSPACPALGLPEVNYAGPPTAAPWSALRGRLWLSHHRNFDRHVYERLRELRIIPDYKPAAASTPDIAGDAPDTPHPPDPIPQPPPATPYSLWHDTADLAAYCHLPRALGKILQLRFGLALDKEARTGMDGVLWDAVPEPDRDRMLTYALEDAAACWLVWATLAPQWPEHERALSLHTGQIEFRGIPVNQVRIAHDIGVLEHALAKTRTRIPWVEQEDEATGRPYALRSKKALDRECQKCGVPVPASTAQKSRAFLDWLDAHGASVPAIFELVRYRRIDRALHIYRALLARLRPDGRAALGLKYMGADKTGRWSGASKFNLQNLGKVPLYFDADHGWLEPGPQGAPPAGCIHAVDIRAALTASPGRRLLIPDLSQIEPRVLAWFVGDRDFLRLCASGLSPYEAHAAASGYRWEGSLKKTQPGMYALFKARLLALGYGAGWHKFIEMARGYCDSEAQFLSIFAVPPPDEDVTRFVRYLDRLASRPGSPAARERRQIWEGLDTETRHIWVNAWVQVEDFRTTNPLIAHRKDGLWARLERDFKSALKVSALETEPPVFEKKLPSGRVLKYFSVNPLPGWSSRPGNPLARPQSTYGGLLAENLVQAIARDVFAHGLLQLEAAGYEVLFHVHDEAIVDAPLDTDPAAVSRLLCAVPAWCHDLPVASECEQSAHYKK